MIRAITLTLNPETMTFDETTLKAAQEGQNVVKWDWQLVENGKRSMLRVGCKYISKVVCGPRISLNTPFNLLGRKKIHLSVHFKSGVIERKSKTALQLVRK